MAVASHNHGEMVLPSHNLHSSHFSGISSPYPDPRNGAHLPMPRKNSDARALSVVTSDSDRDHNDNHWAENGSPAMDPSDIKYDMSSISCRSLLPSRLVCSAVLQRTDSQCP